MTYPYLSHEERVVILDDVIDQVEVIRRKIMSPFSSNEEAKPILEARRLLEEARDYYIVQLHNQGRETRWHQKASQ